MAKKTTELFLLFHKNITKLVFLWPNMGQKSIKVLIKNYIKSLFLKNLVVLLFLTKFEILKKQNTREKTLRYKLLTVYDRNCPPLDMYQISQFYK